MSNKIVPETYRKVVDEVIAAVKPEFEEYGVSEDVLLQLQQKWEAKILASRVADFEPPTAPVPAPVLPQYQPNPLYGPVHAYAPSLPTVAHHMPHLPGPTHSQSPSPVKNEHIKSEPRQYSLPPLPGPRLNLPPMRQHPNGAQTGVLAFPGPLPVPIAPPRIPQVDGPSEDDSDEYDTPPPPAFAPRAAHPSLPQPAATASSAVDGDEAINSDLDDSDDEDEDLEEGAGANADILFCTYDKVTRVKSKWKCILKDGMLHANGKDYLFQRCTCEFNFEWP
ncbi:Transcription factor IIA, alpha/beta subunit [Mycena kentingensis (nom. inval.)]|nr:Transcription factor IIA, alpha/beta subunit [Mycena kentingensis (nom. inval.)]